MENYLSLSSLQVVQYILPLVTVPYLVRVLGPEKWGLIAFAQAFVQYFIFLTDYGFNLSATRKISILRDNRQRVSGIFSSVILIKFVLMLTGFLLLLGLVFAIPKFHEDWLLYILTFSAVIGNVLFPVWFFQGMEKMRYITFLNILARGIFTVSIFLFIRQQADYLYVPLINSLGSIAAGILSMWIVYRNFNTNFRTPALADVVEQLKEGWYIFVSTIAISLYTTSNIVILGLFTNNTIVGYYSAAEKLITAVRGLLTPVSQTIYPHISKLASESKEKALRFMKKSAGLVGSASFLVSLALFIFAKPIVYVVFGNQYQSSVVILKILGFLPFIIALSNIFAIQGLYSFGYYKIVSKFVVLCAVIYLPAVITFTYFFHQIGTAISAVTIEVVITLLSIYYFTIKFKQETKLFLSRLLKKLPSAIKKKYIEKLIFMKRYGFYPPPEWSDMTRYEILLDVIIQNRTYRLDGHFVEIGAFLGGGTYKLSHLLKKLAPEKKIYAIDVFEPDADKSMCAAGAAMTDLYKGILQGRDQYEIYKQVTKNCKNIVTIKKDSREVTLPCQNLCFAYIDGNHAPEYVRNDFFLVWDKLVPDGLVVFDDYGFDLPQVTKTIHDLISENRDKIRRIWTVGLKTIFIQKA